MLFCSITVGGALLYRWAVEESTIVKTRVNDVAATLTTQAVTLDEYGERIAQKDVQLENQSQHLTALERSNEGLSRQLNSTREQLAKEDRRNTELSLRLESVTRALRSLEQRLSGNQTLSSA